VGFPLLFQNENTNLRKYLLTLNIIMISTSVLLEAWQLIHGVAHHMGANRPRMAYSVAAKNGANAYIKFL
jgi:hypothetical protein